MSAPQKPKKKINGDMQKEKTFPLIQKVKLEPPFTIRYSANPIPPSEFIDDYNIEF